MHNKNPNNITLNKITRTYFYLLGLVLVTLVACSLLSNQIGPIVGQDPNAAYVLKVTILIVTSLAMLAGFYFPSKSIKRLTTEMPIEKKMEAYKKGQFLRFAIFSLAAILVSLFFLLTADSNILLVQAIILILMIIYKPSAFRIKADLMLTDDEWNDLLGSEKV
jgi:hypothetical protein